LLRQNSFVASASAVCIGLKTLWVGSSKYKGKRRDVLVGSVVRKYDFKFFFFENKKNVFYGR